MLRRKFGKIPTDVSVVGFGGGSISGEGGGYGFGAISEQQSIDLVRQSLEAGINLFDTAPIYGFGESERRLGKALRDKRDQVFVISKSGVTWDDNKRVFKSNDVKVTTAMLEQSLRDLAMDVIDLYMIHWPDEMVDIRKPMEVLVRAKEEGKIKHIGLCNSYPDDIAKAQEIAPVEVLQNEYNLFSRSYVENELLPLVRAYAMGFMSYGTLDKGLLTGRVTKERKFDEHDARSKAPWWKKADREPKYRAMEQIMPLLTENHHTGLQLALSFVLRREELSTALCGVKSLEQLETATAAVHNLVPDHILEQALRIAADEVKDGE